MIQLKWIELDLNSRLIPWGGNEVTWNDEIIDVIVVNFSFIVVDCYLSIVVVYLMALKWNRNELNLICGSSYGLIWVLSWVYSIY